MNLSILLVFVFMFFAATNDNSCSQTESGTATGFYKGKEVEYYRNKLKVYLMNDSINNESYMNKVRELVSSKQGYIDSIYSISNSKMAAVKFDDNEYDVLKHIKDFEDSKLFKYVALYYVLRPEDLDY